MEKVNILNLTTGLEFLEKYGKIFHGFSRLQSSHLESKQFEKFLNSLDNNILMHLALGSKVCIFDMTSRKRKGNMSRVCWQGIPWIVYVLERIWFNNEPKFKYGMERCFREKFHQLSKCTLRRLKYYRKFVQCDEVKLYFVCKGTDNDGNNEYYKKLMKKYY